MKHITKIAAIAALFAIGCQLFTAQAQTLNVTVGSVTYQFPASQAGDMAFDEGTTFTVMGKTFSASDITAMSIDDSAITDGTIGVAYNGSAAAVTVAGNIAQYVTPIVNGAHVSIAQSDNLAEEITYTLSGTSTDGEFYMLGSYKVTLVLNGLTLTNAQPISSGAAIHIQNGKRINIKLTEGTVNTLADAASGSQKGCLYVKGHAEFKQKGTLNVVGNLKHGIKTGEYISVKNATINVTSAVGDGINCAQYFLIESGNVSISGTGDDGLQCDIDDTDTGSTGETTDHEDEDSGNIYIEGGAVTVSVSAAASKGIKAEGDLRISDGTVDVTTTGNGAYDSDERDAKGCAGLKSDGNMTIAGGTITLKSTGTGGKCIKADGKLDITGGIITATSTGSQYRYSSSATASAKAIKSDGAMTISGGTTTASSASHEAIESKSTLDISGGYVYASASDDAINSSSHMTISGGYVMANSSGNDGLDANGNLYIKGGNVFAVASSQPEVGIDANTEGSYKLYISGGNVVAIGGFENSSSITSGTAMSASYSKGSWYALYNGSEQAFAFRVPSNNSMGQTMAVYTTGTPALKSGVTASGTTIWNGYGSTEATGGSDVTLSTYSSGGGMGPGGGQGGPGGNQGGHGGGR